MQPVEHIQQIVGPILKRHGVRRGALFGSCARGDAQHGSDVDLLVELPKGTGMFAYMSLKRELEAALGVSVDLVTYRALHSLIRPYVERDMVPIV